MTWPDEVLITLISQPGPQGVVLTLPPEELLELLEDELLEDELLLDELLVDELLLLDELLDELLLELPAATVVPAITVGTVGIPEVGFFEALTAMLLLLVPVTTVSRSAAFRLPS